MFASKTDIQAWIQSDKIEVDDANSQKPSIEAERIIRGQLAGFFSPLVLSLWVDPTTTPPLIRSIAGRLTAAFMHAVIYSEESDSQTSAYSQWLYTLAMMDLARIVAGEMTVVDDDGNVITTEGEGLLSFFPDDSTVPTFTISQAFS